MSRMTQRQAVDLLVGADLHELGERAGREVTRRFPGPVRTYIVDRNINYSNVCVCGCRFCNFWQPEAGSRSFVLSDRQILDKIGELVALGGSQVLLQGGHHPTLPFTWYLEMLRTIKRHFPMVHVHGFSPPEIFYFHRRFEKSVEDVLRALREAGLDTIPGGGAEILVERVRRLVSPRKCTADEWLTVSRTAHRLGLRTTATMMLGQMETPAERIEHLRRLRELQDETGGFTAFIPWTFQPHLTPLAQEHSIAPASVQDYLRTLAVGRLFLDNFENLQASWVTQGPAVGQVALKFGANDFGSLMIEENVVATAGVSFRLKEQELRAYIRRAGYQPRRRDCYYRLVESAGDATG